MITVEQATVQMQQAVVRNPVEKVSLAEATGRSTSAEVIAPHDHPLFDMSAVDGYALASATHNEWEVVGEVAAGSLFDRALKEGEAVRIFTGATVPEGVEAVVMQEVVLRNNEHITHRDERLRKGSNIRYRAEQVREGDVLLQAGIELNAAAIGLLASVGVGMVEVAQRPNVLVIVTGDEFTEVDHPAPGKIFSSNDVLLVSILSAYAKIDVVHAKDTITALSHQFSRGADQYDLILTTGGVSVGDHDLVARVLNDLHAEIRFHGVQQKPGKPMLFAQLGTTPVIGLPGNPRAVFVLCFVYVLPFLRAMAGIPWPDCERSPLTEAVEKKGDRAEFRAARVANGAVELLRDEGSHMLRSLIDANALVYLPADRSHWEKNDPVQFYPL